MNWSRLTINLDPETAAAAKEIARKQRRSFSVYVATLIEGDLAAGGRVSEPEAKYEVTAKPKKPDKTSRPPPSWATSSSFRLTCACAGET